MKISLPVAVQFLPKGNRELSRNLASYLSLAAIDYAYLLSPHVTSIMDSIMAGKLYHAPNEYTVQNHIYNVHR